MLSSNIVADWFIRLGLSVTAFYTVLFLWQFPCCRYVQGGDMLFWVCSDCSNDVPGAAIWFPVY